MSTHDLQPDLQEALNDCYEEFKNSHGRFGHAVHVLCYDRLLSERLPELQSDDWQARRQAWLKIRSDDYEASLIAFDEWMSSHPELRIHFNLTGRDTPSAIFRAFFDFYVGLIVVDARRIFADLIKIGGIAWAKEQASILTRNYRYLVIEWVRTAVDKQADQESWRASLFLTMQPAGRKNYDSERAWERMDADSSREVLDYFADEYVDRLESYIKKDARGARLAAVKCSPDKAPSLEAQEDSNAETWQKLDERINNAPPGATLNHKQTASYFHKSERTIYDWLEKSWLDRSSMDRSAITIESIRRFKSQPRPKKRKKRARKKM